MHPILCLFGKDAALKMHFPFFCKRTAPIIAVIFLMFFFVYSSAMEEPAVTLSWTPNPPEEQVEKYTVFVGSESRFSDFFQGYEFEIDVPADCPDNECLCDLPSPPVDGSYYYVSMVARSGSGLSSDYSVEVMYASDTAGQPPGGNPPPIKVSVSNGGGGSVGGCFLRSLL